MGSLFDSIRRAVEADRVLISSHADDSLRDRSIMAWQVIAGVLEGRILVERPGGRPNPVVEVEQTLPDATPVKAVWGYVVDHDVALLITVHFFDR